MKAVNFWTKAGGFVAGKGTSVMGGVASKVFNSHYSTIIKNKTLDESYQTQTFRSIHTVVEDVYGVLDPKFKEQFTPVQKVIENKFLNAAIRGIVGGLIGGNASASVLEGHDQESACKIVKQGLLLTKDEPINLPLSEKGTVTGAKISRTLGKSAHLIGEFTRALVLKGGVLSPELIAEATRAARLYSFTPGFSLEIDGFNQRNKGHQAYDLRRIIALEEEKERNGTHTEVWDEAEIEEEDIFGKHGVLFTRWMQETKGTEKDIAAKMFPPGKFAMPSSHDDVIQYFIGCWAGARATRLTLAMMDGKKDGKFMGYDEAETWAMNRLAMSDVYNEEFWMPTDKNGNHTRSTIINSETMTALYIRKDIDTSLQGALHRHQDYYWIDFKARESSAKALRAVYQKSLDVQKQMEVCVQTKAERVTQGRNDVQEKEISMR